MDEPAAISGTSREASRAFPLGVQRPTLAGVIAALYDQRWTLAVIAVGLVALLVRARFVLPAGFPLNDGGLFVAISRDIQQAGYALPVTTSYNPTGDFEIPMAYPPLAFYLAAIIEDITPLSMIQVYWLLPLLGAMLCVAAIYFLARTFFQGRLIPLLATAAFALTPRSFTWLIMGGGLTRSFGLAAALFALTLYRVAFNEDTEPRRRRLAIAGATVLSAATLATHLEAAVFLAVAILLSSVARPTPWRAVTFVTVGAGTVLLSAPWWATVLIQNGIEPFRAAAAFGGDVLADGSVDSGLLERVITPVYTYEPFFAVIGATGVLGAVVALMRGHWVLPTFWAAMIALNMRALPTFLVVPTAILAGYAVVEVLLPVLRSSVASAGSEFGRMRPALVVGALAGIALYGAMEANRGEATYLRPVAEADQRAMAWAARWTPEDATFLVIPQRGWFADREGEWFPVLAERPAINVLQGYEWVDGAFAERGTLHYYAGLCRWEDADCVERMAWREPFTHVFIPAGCCDALVASLERDRRYDVIYSAGGSTIVERTVEEPWRWPNTFTSDPTSR